jgi:uncharacterized protein (TIGR03663 family)
MRERYFYFVFSAILLSAAYLCFSDLTLRPVHHDEGVFGWFRENIYNACFGPGAARLDYGNYAGICAGSTSGYCVMGYPLGPLKRYSEICGRSYSYDPKYHGPFAFIVGAWMFSIFGISDYSNRAPGCIFYLATIFILLLLRKRIGDYGVLSSAALIAYSPSMAYYSQQVLFDTFFAFFTLGSVVCASKLLETGKARWLYLGAANLSFLYTVKESAVIFTAICAGYCALYAVCKLKKGEKIRGEEANLSAAVTPRSLLVSAAVFLVIYSFFYSNMFTNMQLLEKSVPEGIASWLKTSNEWKGHFKPFDYYLSLMWEFEIAIALLSVTSILAFRNNWARWCAFWAAATIFIYSEMPYKTPGNIIVMTLPLALLAGTGINSIAAGLPGWKKILPAAVILPLLAHSYLLAWDVNYVRYADPGNRLAYVASLKSYDSLVADIKASADFFSGKDTVIAVASEQYWPLPWSLRGYRLLYSGGKRSDPLVISARGDYSDISPGMTDRYGPPRRYEIRQNVYLYVYAWKRGL